MTASSYPSGRPRRGNGPNSAKDQVRRLLAMLPYLLAHPGARVSDVARAFRISERQLIRDLGVLWFCGLPGLMPGDYIEVDMDAIEGEGVIHVSNADYLARPLQLTADEALGLLVALRVLRELGQVGERGTVDRVIARLEEATGQASSTVDQVVAVHESDHDAGTAAIVRTAIERQRRLHLTYWVPTRDETTDREVDPLRLVVADGRTYLEAWCRRAEDMRLFRLDRVAQAQVLDVTSDPPPQAEPRDLSVGLFQPSAEDQLVTVDLEPRAAWVAEYYPCEEVIDLGDGRLRVRMYVADPQWMRRLALRLGGAARIVDVPELAEAVRADAERALRAYD